MTATSIWYKFFRLLVFSTIAMLIIIFFIGILLFWPSYKYGVNIQNSEIIVKPYFWSQFSRDYDFHTVLFLSDGYATKSPSAVDQAFSLIYIDHMISSRPSLDNEVAQADKELRVSLLRFGNRFHLKEDRRSIEIQNISLRHFTLNKELIQPFQSNSFSKFSECMKSDHTECLYGVFYQASDIPDKMIEEIDIKFTYKGKHHRIQRMFIIENKPYDNIIGSILTSV